MYTLLQIPVPNTQLTLDDILAGLPPENFVVLVREGFLQHQKTRSHSWYGLKAAMIASNVGGCIFSAITTENTKQTAQKLPRELNNLKPKPLQRIPVAAFVANTGGESK